MIPEVLFAIGIPMVVGWMGFTWRRAENAHTALRAFSDKVDKVELKMAEEYLTKKDFEMSMDRLFKGFDRLEKKIDFHVYDQSLNIRELQAKIKHQDD
jgi:hypothetical protein